MTNHPAVEQVASEVRAAMARKRKTANDLASVLKMSPHTAGSRLNAKVPFNVVEIDVIARWLDVDPATLLPSMQALAPSSPAGAA